jgi:hypothetical protein
MLLTVYKIVMEEIVERYWPEKNTKNKEKNEIYLENVCHKLL